MAPSASIVPVRLTGPRGESTDAVKRLSFHSISETVAWVGKSHIRLLRDGSRFFLIILKIATIFSPLKVFLPVSGLCFAAGLGWYVWTYQQNERFTNASQLAFVLAIVLFALALISEAIR